MRQIEEGSIKERSISPNRFNSDLYIITYQQSQTQINHQAAPMKFNNKPAAVSHATPLFKIIETEGELDHRKNLNRLMTLLQRNQSSYDKGNSACSKIFKYIQKMYKRYWRLRQRNFKVQAFGLIRSYTREEIQRSEMRKFPIQLKDSLEMREDEIQSWSKNFELNELMHIVNLHQGNELQKDVHLQNSLSRKLTHRNEGREQRQKSTKNISSNVFILRKNHSKEEISTRQQLSNNHNASQPFLPLSTRIARSISHNSLDKSPSKATGVQDRQLDQPAHRNSHEETNKLHELSINSMIHNQSQEASDSNHFQEIVKLKFPCLGTKRPQLQGRRTNRLMENTQRKIIFHYKNSKEREASPIIQNEYHLPTVFAKAVQPQQVSSKILQKAPTSQINPNQLTRFQRVSSLQIINPKSSIPHQNPASKPADMTKDRANSLSTRKCSSMPKITFTYLNKEEPFVSPQPANCNVLKNSPILELNKLKGSNPQGKQVDDPYLFKNLQVAATKPIIQPLYSPVQVIQRRPEAYPTGSNAYPANHYYLPNFIPSNNPASHRPQRMKIQSNYQALPSNPKQYIIQQRNDYYAQKSKITTQQTLTSPTRMRVRSTDAYILIRPKENLPKPQNILSNALDRQRARSCNIKMEVVTRKVPLIKAC